MTSRMITRRSTLKRLGAGAVAASTFSLGMPAILRAEDGPIKLGFLTGFTGLETLLGETQFNCFKLAVSEINNSGGIAGRQIVYLEEVSIEYIL